MSSETLTPETHKVLEKIHSVKQIDVEELTQTMKMDRGRIEGAIATLVEKKLVDRQTTQKVQYKLTSRGSIAANGLVERKIIDILLEDTISMKDLNSQDGIEKSDITAGIGILRKAGLIEINKGMVSLTDKTKAETFSINVQEALGMVSKNGNSKIDDELVKELVARGFVEVHETTKTNVSSKLTAAKLKKISVVEEVSRLTPQMLATGSWKNVSFKPYSLKTKPRKLYAGKFHPYRQFLDHVRIKLIGLGFQEMKGPFVEQEFWNFDALYAAQDHPAREDSDILLIKKPTHGQLGKDDYVVNVAKTHENGWKTGSRGYQYKWDPRKAARLLARPQTTAVSARTLAKIENPPAKFFSISRNFRPDQIDATHDVEFDQMEGIICNPDITFTDLLGMLKTFAIEVAGTETARFRPDYYPFTSPSVELSGYHPVLGNIEFGGAGIFRPEVTQPFGIDYPVLAWGIGIGRLFMTKYHIEDTRELYTQNLEWLRDQKVTSGIQVEEL